MAGWLRKFKIGDKSSVGNPSSSPSLTQVANLLPGVYYRLQLVPDLRLVDIGEGIFDLVGYKASELLNTSTMSYLRLIHPELKEILRQKEDHCSQSRQAKKLEYDLMTRSRAVKLIQDHFVGEYDRAGRLVAINGYFKTIEKSSLSLQLLSQLEAYRAAIDVNIISSVTDTNGVIIYANDNFKRVSQYGDEELLGKTHRVVRSGYHPRSFFENMWQTISAGSMWKGEIQNRAKDGSLYWVDTVIIPTFDERNKITSYLSLRVLITGRKQAEEQREKYIQVLEEIAHAVAHDVRGPICSILGLVNVVKESNCREEDLKQVMSYLVQAAGRLDQITRDLSARIYAADLELKESGSDQPIDASANEKASEWMIRRA